MNFQQIMKQSQALQKKMMELQQKLEETEVEGKAGGGLVVITTTAKGAFKKVKIDKSLLVPEDVEILEDMVLAALADAKREADRVASDMMSGLGLSPEIMNML